MKKSYLITILLTAIALFAALSCSRQPRVIWQRRFDTGTIDFGSSVATDGRDIVVGTTCRDTLAVRKHTGWQLLRYDRDGNLEWHRAYNRDMSDSLADIAVAPNHDILGVGCTGSNSTAEVWLDNNVGKHINADPVRLLLARFSAQGDVKWRKEYQFGSLSRGEAIRLDTVGRIWVCGSVTVANSDNSDLLVARFDSVGNLLDSTTIDFGACETGQDLLLVPSHVGAMGVFVTGLRTPLAGKPDTFATRDIVVVSLDPDLHESWRWVYNSGGDDLAARLSWQEGVCLAATSREDSSVVTHVVERNARGSYPQFNQDTRYPGDSNATCRGLTADQGGHILGVGSTGPDEHQHLLGWRYFRGKFFNFLPAEGYVPGDNDRAGAIALDAAGNAIVVGTSGTGKDAGVLTLKVALPRYKPPPYLPYGYGYGGR